MSTRRPDLEHRFLGRYLWMYPVPTGSEDPAIAIHGLWTRNLKYICILARSLDMERISHPANITQLEVGVQESSIFTLSWGADCCKGFFDPLSRWCSVWDDYLEAVIQVAVIQLTQIGNFSNSWWIFHSMCWILRFSHSASLQEGLEKKTRR